MRPPTSRTLIPDERWEGLRGLFGGYVAAIFADASADDEYRLASLAIRFHASVALQPIDLVTTQLHRGGRSATSRMQLFQDGRVRAEAAAVLLRHPAGPSAVRRIAVPVGAPPADHTRRPHPTGELAYLRNLDVRTPPHTGIDGGIHAWLRLAAAPAELGLQTPQAAACVFLDALLPVLFAGDRPPKFVPTLEFSYLFTPAMSEMDQRWHVAENHLDWLADDFCAEDATLRDAATGLLVARQRQLRTVRHGLGERDSEPVASGSKEDGR